MRIVSAALLPLIVLAPSVTEAQKKRVELANGPVGKAPAACGARMLPLVEGNQWTYSPIKSTAEPPPPDLARQWPNQVSKIVITVKSIENKAPDTVVTLEEKTTTDITLNKDPKKHVMDERTITSTITCGAKKFEISPESFFFAGEPGGFFELTFDKLDRTRDTSWKLVNGVFADGEWREDIVAHFTRAAFAASNAKLDSGKLELERKFTPEPADRVNTPIGLYPTERVALTTTGRVTLDHAQTGAPPMDLPANWVNRLWVTPNVGVVQVQNSFTHMYILSAVTLK